MSEELNKLPPRAFGSIIDLLTALRGEKGTAQADILEAAEALKSIHPNLSKRLLRISVAQQAALNKAEGKA